MSYSATPAEERAVDALSLYDDEHAVFRSDVTREELVYLVRHVLDAATTVEPVAEDLAKRHASYLWDPQHRAALVSFLHADAGEQGEANIDLLINDDRRAVLAQFHSTTLLIREILIGEHA